MELDTLSTSFFYCSTPLMAILIFEEALQKSNDVLYTQSSLGNVFASSSWITLRLLWYKYILKTPKNNLQIHAFTLETILKKSSAQKNNRKRLDHQKSIFVPPGLDSPRKSETDYRNYATHYYTAS